MVLNNIKFSIDKKLFAFVDKNEKVSLVIFPDKGEAKISLSLKPGVTPEMISVIDKLSISLDLSDVIMNETESLDRGPKLKTEELPVTIEHKPALPYVNNEYDDVKKFIGEELGDSISSFAGGEGNTQDTEDFSKNKDELEKDQSGGSKLIDDLPLKRVPSEGETENERLMRLQMQEMMSRMEDMQKLITNNESLNGKNTKVEAKRPKIDSIVDMNELFACIDSVDMDELNVDENKRMTRQELQEIERFNLKKPAYIISSSNQLFINDIGVSIKNGVATNLASIPMYKLKKSVELKQCLKNGKLKLISGEDALEMLERANNDYSGKSGIEAFVGADGEGIKKAAQGGIDISTGRSEEEVPISYEDMVSSSRENTIQVEDYDEFGDSEDQVALVNLAGMGVGEDASEAYISSQRNSSLNKSSKQKSISRLG